MVTGGFRHGMPPPGEPRRVPFGEGVTPFAAAFRKLAEMNFNGPILLEMWNDDAPDSLKVVEEARCWVEARMVEGGLIDYPQGDELCYVPSPPLPAYPINGLHSSLRRSFGAGEGGFPYPTNQHSAVYAE